MAFLKDSKPINAMKNLVKDGFADGEGFTIRNCADFVQTADAAENIRQDGANISSTFGYIIAWILNASNKNEAIADVDAGQLLLMYLRLAEAPYKGYPVEYRITTYDSSKEIEEQCISDLQYLKIRNKSTGLEKKAENVLELVINDRVIGMYFPAWKCFVPGADFGRDDTTDGVKPEVYMDLNPHVTHRCRAILTELLEYGAYKDVIERVLRGIGGPVPADEMDIYRGEAAENIAADVTAYILETSPDADPAAVCGCMGRNSSDLLLDTPVLINTGTAPVQNMNRTFKKIGSNLVMIPPVQNVNSIDHAVYKLGPLNEQEIPAWIDFSAELNGILHHRIYAQGIKICQPDNVIDLSYKVPDGILAKYNYMVQGSGACSMGANDLETVWKVYPEDSTENSIPLSSAQYAGEWEIHQRSVRIERMELCDASTGEVLGSILPEKAPAFHAANKHMYLSLDPAGAVSVRLKSTAGSGSSEALEYPDMIRPLTPMAGAELEQTVERRLISSERAGTHFDSLLQRFFSSGTGGWSGLMVESRVWKPDEAALFEALQAYPGTMTEAMTNLGVISNMKEMITRSGLKKEEKPIIVWALKNYIGTMLLESVLSLAKEGFSVQAGNLEFLISYPENGSGEGTTKEIRSSIEGAIAFVNEYLLPGQQLVIGVNTTLCSESEATAVWHQINPPADSFMGANVPAGTPDYGHSTHDFSLRVNGHLYQFSIPYAAQKITNATLAKVYDGNASALLRCFSGGSQDLKQQALRAMEEAMKSAHGKLYERLGFILPLNRLFSSCTFHVTGINGDSHQMKLQQLTEAKLNIAIPAYAYAIVRAMNAGDLKSSSSVLLAPVGKGSLALDNTAPGFAERFTERLYAEINYLMKRDGSFPEGETFTGKIRLLPNNDTNKVSVAQGMIEMKENSGSRKKAVTVPQEEPLAHYLDLVYGSGENADEKAKEQFYSELNAFKIPAQVRAYNSMREQIYEQAFHCLVESYTYEQFEAAFNRFGYTGITEGIPEEEIGVFDETIRGIVENQFDNLCAQLEEQGKQLIMSCPYIEEEMLSSAMVDLAIERMNFFPDKK